MPSIPISEDVVAAIRAHALRAYPDECCGALLSNDVANAVIVRAVPLENESNEAHAHRFFVSPDVVRSVEESAAAEHLFIAGFYHSHPDAPAVPSQYDNQHAVSWLLSLIVACTKSDADAVRAFEFDLDTRALVERALDIVPGPHS